LALRNIANDRRRRARYRELERPLWDSIRRAVGGIGVQRQRSIRAVLRWQALTLAVLEV
jgi:hypothetical protein